MHQGRFLVSVFRGAPAFFHPMKKAILILLVSLAFVMGFASKRKEQLAALSEARVSTQEPSDPALLKRDQAQRRIEDAARAFTPEGARVIAGFLSDPDPQLRSLARESLIRTGEPNGIPALRLAALHMKDPVEAQACHRAADLIEQPSVASQAPIPPTP